MTRPNDFVPCFEFNSRTLYSQIELVLGPSILIIVKQSSKCFSTFYQNKIKMLFLFETYDFWSCLELQLLVNVENCTSTILEKLLCFQANLGLMTCLDTYIDVLNCPELDKVIVICSITVYKNWCKQPIDMK